MYYQYFGLEEAPFSIAVDPRYLFMSRRHRDALAHLLYGVGSGGGFVLLTGEVGTGKTTINRCLLEQLPEGTEIAIVLNPTLNPVELLATICDELGITYNPDAINLKALTDRLQEHLLKNHAAGLHTVLLIDEAQHLGVDALEQVRLLTNLETNTRKLLQIILVGQPELSDMLARPELRQLSQRITARFSLVPLNLEETNAYIHHRLKVAGLRPPRSLFASGAVRYIHRVTGGIPRLINVVSDRALLGSYGRNKPMVEKSVVRQAAREVLGESKTEKPGAGAVVGAAVGIAVLLAVSLALWVDPATNEATLAEDIDSVATLKQEADPKIAETDYPGSLTTGVGDTPLASAPESIGASSVTGLMGYSSSQAAMARLISALSAGRFTSLAGRSTDGCVIAESVGLRCEEDELLSWQELQDLNRPVVLELLGDDRFNRYLPVTGIRGQKLLVATESDLQSVLMATLGASWTGKVRYLWNPPVGYNGTLSAGDRSRMVFWLAEEFARRDGGSRRLADLEFNESLRQRVILFQRAHGLKADGVVGLKTLRKLTEAIPGAITLNSMSQLADAPLPGGS